MGISNIIYIRELDKATLIDRKTRETSNEIITTYDDIIKNHSSFCSYIDEYDKVFRYRDKTLLKDVYVNGELRKNSRKVKKYFNVLIDLLTYKKTR